MADSKSTLMSILAKKAPPSPMEEEEDMGSDGVTIAQDILSAIKADDPEALNEALQAHFNSLESEPHEEAPATPMMEEE